MVAIIAAPLVALGALFVAVGVVFMHWTRQAALWRAALVLVCGSVVFLLPNSVNPPATADFWWANVLEKYAASCVPYPCVGWLVMPGIRRRLAVEVCAALAAVTALVWPALLDALRDQTADVLRRELALPQSPQTAQLEAEFAVLFADLRHPTSAQLVATGLAGGPSPLE